AELLIVVAQVAGIGRGFVVEAQAVRLPFRTRKDELHRARFAAVRRQIDAGMKSAARARGGVLLAHDHPDVAAGAPIPETDFDGAPFARPPHPLPLRGFPVLDATTIRGGSS